MPSITVENVVTLMVFGAAETIPESTEFVPGMVGQEEQKRHLLLENLDRGALLLFLLQKQKIWENNQLILAFCGWLPSGPVLQGMTPSR